MYEWYYYNNIIIIISLPAPIHDHLDAVMWCLETLSRLKTVSRQTFRCLGLGLEGHCLGLGLGLGLGGDCLGLGLGLGGVCLGLGTWCLGHITGYRYSVVCQLLIGPINILVLRTIKSYGGYV
jgi:hypothetical protein